MTKVDKMFFEDVTRHDALAAYQLFVEAFAVALASSPSLSLCLV